MKNIAVSDRTYDALTRLAENNFRTVDLQISFWLSQDLDLAEKRSYAKRKVEGKRNKWSHAKREAQSERMKKMWAEGAIRPRKKVGDPVDLGHVSFDD